MKCTTFGMLCLLAVTSLMGCNPDDDDKNTVTPEPEKPVVKYSFYMSGKMNGTAFYWHVDTTTYKQALAPYNARNVSTGNNYIRYGTSIVPNNVNQVPYLGVEFNGFLGNSTDKVSAAAFQGYFKTGNYLFSNRANMDNTIGVNIFHEQDLNYTTMHESSWATQPSTSFFTIDTVTIVKLPSTHAYIKARFAAVLKSNNTAEPDIAITDGEMRIFVHNSLEE